MLCLVCLLEKDDKDFKISKTLNKIMIENVLWCNRCQKDYLIILKETKPIRIDLTDNHITFN